MRVMEGAEAIAEAVRVAGPRVVSAYPITPQTHVVEALSQAVADGTLDAEFITVESEHSAASVVLGASATGVRTFTATSSQGLLYMAEVVFNIAGMRLPVVMTVANRALSAPLSIWNDHQDSMTLRDAGWVQLFAQTAQEAHDLHLIAYRLAEDPAIRLPVMVCVDGYVLTHAFEAVEPVDEATAARFLPPLSMSVTLDPDHPATFGAFADSTVYTEARFAIEAAHRRAPAVLAAAFDDFAAATGRRYSPDIDSYRTDDADVILVVMGTAAQTAQLAADALRAEGTPTGVLSIRRFRPFPAGAITDAVRNAKRVVVFDRSVSIGSGGIVAGEIRSALHGKSVPSLVALIGGLGGRDVSIATLKRAMRAERDGWIDADPNVVEVAL